MLKSLVIAAISLTAAVAHADPVRVATPKGPVTVASASAYVNELDAAVQRVCRRAASPIIGTNYYLYMDCLKRTRADVAKKDPTGLYALRGQTAGTALASR